MQTEVQRRGADNETPDASCRASRGETGGGEVSDATKFDAGIVYEGANRIIVNAGTMHRIVQAWLHEHHSGGPYTVTAVTETGRGLGAQEFEIKFTTETTK